MPGPARLGAAQESDGAAAEGRNQPQLRQPKPGSARRSRDVREYGAHPRQYRIRNSVVESSPQPQHSIVRHHHRTRQRPQALTALGCFRTATGGRPSLPHRRRSACQRTCGRRSRPTSRRPPHWPQLGRVLPENLPLPGLVVAQPCKSQPVVAPP